MRVGGWGEGGGGGGRGVTQGTTGPKVLRGPPSRGQQRGEGNVLKAAQVHGGCSQML